MALSGITLLLNPRQELFPEDLICQRGIVPVKGLDK